MVWHPLAPLLMLVCTLTQALLHPELVGALKHKSPFLHDLGSLVTLTYILIHACTIAPTFALAISHSEKHHQISKQKCVSEHSEQL